jgi:hypothetical protein
VAIPSQTQLQEDLPEDVRGRVFGVLNMLVSVASFLPILIVGPIADLVGTTAVMVIVAGFVVIVGVLSIYLRGPLRAVERDSRAAVGAHGDPFIQALGAEVAGDDPQLVDVDGAGVVQAIPTGLGPTAVDVPPQVVAAAEGREGSGAAPGEPAPEADPDPDRDDDRDPSPAG